MRFDVVDVTGGDSRVPVGVPEHVDLAFAAWRDRRSTRAAVIHDAAAPDQGVDLVAVCDRLRQRFHDDHDNALAADVAVGSRITEPAPSVRREHSGLGQRYRQVGGQDDIDTAGHREGALPGADALARQVDGEQGRGARRVQRHTRATQVEGMRQASRRRASALCPDGAVQVADTRVAQELRIGGGQVGQEDAGATAGERVLHLAGVLECLPDGFQQHALLRVHSSRLPRRDVEETRVEGVEILQDPTGAADDPSRGSRIRVVETTETAVLGKLGHGVMAGSENLPEFVQAMCTWQPASHPDNGYGVRTSFLPLARLDRTGALIQRPEHDSVCLPLDGEISRGLMVAAISRGEACVFCEGLSRLCFRGIPST